jgi:hypothetical protein
MGQPDQLFGVDAVMLWTEDAPTNWPVQMVGGFVLVEFWSTHMNPSFKVYCRPSKPRKI